MNLKPNKFYMAAIIYLMIIAAGVWIWLGRQEQSAWTTASHRNKKVCLTCNKILYSTSKPLRDWFLAERKKNKALHVSESKRGKFEQEVHLEKGRSQAAYGQSPHNYTPSRALDVMFLSDAGQPIWEVPRFKELADRLPESIEWGGHWKGFKDNPHFQERGWTNYVFNYPHGDLE